MKYVKKPIPIEAWRLTYENVEAGIPDFIKEEMDKAPNSRIYMYVLCDTKEAYADIKTLEGTMRCNHGDYILKGIHGEFYPCKPDIFEESYEEYKEE